MRCAPRRDSRVDRSQATEEIMGTFLEECPHYSLAFLSALSVPRVLELFGPRGAAQHLVAIHHRVGARRAAKFVVHAINDARDAAVTVTHTIYLEARFARQ